MNLYSDGVSEKKVGKLKVSRRAFTLEYKAEMVQHKLAENLTATQTEAKFDLLPTRV